MLLQPYQHQNQLYRLVGACNVCLNSVRSFQQLVCVEVACNGIDIATGTPVRAAFSGRVTFAGSLGGYGLLVKVNHGNGVETRYGHNSKILVKVGQIVEAGQVLARSGNTGVSTGPHVHFEIRKNGTAVNPASYLR